jgi:hypothetical protein
MIADQHQTITSDIQRTIGKPEGILSAATTLERYSEPMDFMGAYPLAAFA